MYGYIYEITNLLNGKKYIGQHKASSFDEDYHGSGKLLLQSINKNGWENNYSYKILEPINNIATICDTKEDLDKAEEFYISYFNCVNSNDYYNLKPGGIGKSEKGLTYIRDPETNKCKKVSNKDLNTYLERGFIIGGPIPSKEVVEKRQLSNTGKKRSDEQKKNISKSLKGKKLSEEHKKALQHPKRTSNWRKGLITVIKNDTQISIKEEYI